MNAISEQLKVMFLQGCTRFLTSEYCFSTKYHILIHYTTIKSQSQWPLGLRRSSAATRMLRLWVRIPPRAWMVVCCECCVLSGRGLCNELVTHPEESYRLWCIIECDLETSFMRRPWPSGGVAVPKTKKTNNK